MKSPMPPQQKIRQPCKAHRKQSTMHFLLPQLSEEVSLSSPHLGSLESSSRSLAAWGDHCFRPE